MTRGSDTASALAPVAGQNADANVAAASLVDDPDAVEAAEGRLLLFGAAPAGGRWYDNPPESVSGLHQGVYP